MHGRDEITFVLQAQPKLAGFFAEEGFEPAAHMYQRARRSPKA
jgi:predicted GNAT family N-acyltransferase